MSQGLTPQMGPSTGELYPCEDSYTLHPPGKGKPQVRTSEDKTASGPVHGECTEDLKVLLV